MSWSASPARWRTCSSRAGGPSSSPRAAPRSVAEAGDQLVGQAVVPRAGEPRDVLLELVEATSGAPPAGRAAGRRAAPRRPRRARGDIDGLRRSAPPAAPAGGCAVGRHAVARHRDHDGDVAAGGVAAHGHGHALRLLARAAATISACSASTGAWNSSSRGERLERGDRRLVVVRALDEALGLDDRLQLAPQERRARGLLEIDERGEQADHAPQARDRAVGPQDAHETSSMRARRCTRSFGWSCRSRAGRRSRRGARSGTPAAPRGDGSAKRDDRRRAGCRVPSPAGPARSARRPLRHSYSRAPSRMK